MVQNTQVIYKAIPEGLPVADQTFEVVKSTIDVDDVKLDEGTILIRTIFASLDPYMRFRMRDPKIKSYFPAAEMGKPMTGGVIGEVLRSNAEGFKKGEVISTFGGWEEYSVVRANMSQLIPNARELKFPLSYYLGVAGMPGMTAYIGLHKICEPIKEGETLFVSAASGAVGQVVGQYAKHLGLRVVGCAGTDEKVKYLTEELGFDAAFNHRTQTDYVKALKETCPNGIDIYFENVGGKMLDAVLVNANNNARIPICGMISQYNNKPGTGDHIQNLPLAIGKSIRLQGFIVSNDTKEYGAKATKVLGDLLQKGNIKYKEHIVQGIENLPHTFIDMLEGRNFGKAAVAIAEL